MLNRVKSMSMLPNAVLWLFAFGLLLDTPAAKAYNEHAAWTKILGAYLFHGFREQYGIPLPFTLFEILSYSILFVVLARSGSQRPRLWSCVALLAIFVPMACALGTLTGIFRGHQIRLAFSQLHFMPMLSAWLLIGYYLGTNKGSLLQAARIMFWVGIWRSCYAMYVYWLVLGGKMGTREFLIDHASSAFLVGGMCYALMQSYLRRHHFREFICYIFGFLLMLWPYILNDRRASFLGISVGFILLPWILPQQIRRRLLIFYWPILICASLIMSSHSLRKGEASSMPITGQEAAEISVDKLDYRQIENYNLMLGVIERPLLGLGFGTRFPQLLALPDISFSFVLFDAIPHNTLLFLWTFAGPLGISAFCTLSCLLMTVIVRVGKMARFPSDVLLAVMGMVMFMQWLMYVGFDMGLLESRLSMLIGVFGAGLIPLYGRIVVEQVYAKCQISKVESFVAADLQPARLR